MKKTLLSAIFLCVGIMAFSQSQRTVLIEEFTQASCPPCETTTPALNAITEANADKLVQIRYQTSWPGVDPMNADNPGEVAARVTYYGVSGVPSVQADGTETSSPGSLPQADIDNSYAVSSPVLVAVSHSVADDLSSYNVTVDITNEGTEAYAVSTNKLRVVLVEEVVSWPYRPGSTSIVDFEAVMKAFVTGAAGIDIPEIAAGETWSNTWENVAMPANVYNYGELAIVAFVQDDATKKTVNSAHSSPVSVPGYSDLSLVYAELTDDGGICDAYSANVEVENRGTIADNGYSVSLFANGNLVETQTMDADLAPGESTTIDFGEVAVTGTSVITYQVETDKPELGTLNNATRASAVGRVGASVAELNSDFESEDIGAYPTNGLVDVPFTNLNFIVVDAAALSVTTPIGAYTESDQSIIVNFWQWNPATVGNANGSLIVADQFDVPTGGAELVFDYAYTPYQGSGDRLQVQVSTDCGDTYTDVFNKAGSQLQTAPEVNNGEAGGYFKPSSADHWRTETIDLSAYEGQEVLIRYYVTSAWGDQLYLDNIQMRSTTDIVELSGAESISVYPNPAHDVINLSLDIDTPADVSFKLINVLGNVVANKFVGANMNGKIDHTIDASNLATGSYILYIQLDDREVIQRVNIAH